MNQTTITRTAQAEWPLRVTVKNANGDISIEAVDGLTQASAERRGDGSVDLEAFAPDFADGTLNIDVPPLLDREGGPGFAFSIGRHSWRFGNNQPEVTIAVRVPRDSSVTAETQNGDVSLRGRFAEVGLSTGNGDVTLDEAVQARLSTGSGDVSAHRVDGDLKATTGSGDISIHDNGGAVKANTGSGDISVARTRGESKLQSGSGDLTIGEVDGDLKLSSGSGDFTIREIVAGAIQAQTASGDITFGVRRAIPVWTDCSTMVGEVSSTLLGAGEPTEGQPFIEIRATTVSGHITLTEA